MEQKLSTEHRLTEVEERSKSNTHRIDVLEKKQDNLDKLVGAVEILADREKRVEGDVKEIKDDVKSIKDKPAKRWESLITQIISILVAAIAGFIIAKLGF